MGLFHKLINGLAQVIDGGLVPGSHGIDHAVAHMVLENDLSRVIQGGTDGGQLNQHLRAVLSFFYHPLDLFQVADGPGEPVENGFLVFVDMAVGVGNAMGVEIFVIVYMFVVMFMNFGHGDTCFPYFLHYTPILHLSQAPGFLCPFFFAYREKQDPQLRILLVRGGGFPSCYWQGAFLLMFFSRRALPHSQSKRHPDA